MLASKIMKMNGQQKGQCRSSPTAVVARKALGHTRLAKPALLNWQSMRAHPEMEDRSEFAGGKWRVITGLYRTPGAKDYPECLNGTLNLLPQLQQAAYSSTIQQAQKGFMHSHVFSRRLQADVGSEVAMNAGFPCCCVNAHAARDDGSQEQKPPWRVMAHVPS